MGAIEDHGYTFKADISDPSADGYVKRRDGAVVGELNTMHDDVTDTYVVLLAILDSTVPKGKGIGADLYTRLADEIKRKTGKRLSSEKKLQSPSAAKMWQKMVAQGQAQGPIKMGSKEMFVTEDDKLPGGLADKKRPSDFDPEQIKLGIKHELEHTNDRDLAREIAMDHLSEDPKYYSHLKENRMSMRKLFKLNESALNESEDLLSQFEDNYPDGLCPKKWIVRLFKTHGRPDVDQAWREYSQETGAPSTMPEQVEWQPVLAWMGY